MLAPLKHWTVSKKGAEESAVPATVPGDVATDFERAGRPLSAEDLRTGAFVYVCEFAWPPPLCEDDGAEEAATAVLVCEGLDTLCSLELNGTPIGAAENMFRRWTFELPPALLLRTAAAAASSAAAGPNVLRIEFAPVMLSETGSGGGSKADEAPCWEYTQPPNGQRRLRVRKAACHFGWDFCAPALVCGIWQPAYIVSLGQNNLHAVALVPSQVWSADMKSVRISCALHFERGRGCKPLSAALKVTLIDPSGSVLVVGRGDPKQISAEAEALEGHVTLPEVPRDLLWNPRGHGAQPLCMLRAEAIDAHTGRVVGACERRVGLRRVELSRGAKGKAFCFVVNGVSLFCKGANIVPIDRFHGKVTAARERQLLELCCEQNFNMIRVWGGGIYQTTSFYDTCDELGLLVFQDFMFSCGCYPTTPEFLNNVREEVVWQTRRLSHHPCIALWCGNNEVEEGIMFPQGPFGRGEVKESYKFDCEKLFRDTIAATVLKEDPTRPFVRTSPSRCIVDGPFDEHAGNQDDGDSHWWGLWHGVDPVDLGQVLEIRPRFCSEFGFQSLPSARSLRAASSSLEELCLSHPGLASRQFSAEGNSKLLRAIAQLLPDAAEITRMGLAREVFLSQVFQSLAVCSVIDHLRRLWPFCAGSLYWMLNDVEAVPSWSSVGFGENPKMLHFCAARAFAPIAVSSAVVGEELAIWISNDTQDPVCGRVVAKILEIATGRVVTASSATASIGPVSNEHVLDVALPWFFEEDEDEEEEELDDEERSAPPQASECMAVVSFKSSAIAAGQQPIASELFFDIRGASAVLQRVDKKERPFARITKVETCKSPAGTTLVTVEAVNGICPFCWVDAGEHSRCSENCFTLLPSKEQTVICKHSAEHVSPSVSCLWDATLGN